MLHRHPGRGAGKTGCHRGVAGRDGPAVSCRYAGLFRLFGDNYPGGDVDRDADADRDDGERYPEEAEDVWVDIGIAREAAADPAEEPVGP